MTKLRMYSGRDALGLKEPVLQYCETGGFRTLNQWLDVPIVYETKDEYERRKNKDARGTDR